MALRNLKAKDNAEGQLNAGISSGALSIVLKSGEGALFPTTINGPATSSGSATVLNSTGIGATGIAVGDIIENVTDGSVAIVVSVSTDSITTTELRGGSGNTWDSADKWHVNRFVITLNKRSGGAITTSEKVLIDSRSGDTLTVNASGRGWDGDTPTAFDADDYVNLFVTSVIVEYHKEILSQLIRDFQLLKDDVNNNYATKTFVEALINARTWKDAVVAATTTSGTLASDFENGDTIDGVTLSTDDRILIKDQADKKENGVYTVNASGAPTRAEDFDEDDELTAAVVPVEQGTVNGDTIWIQTTDTPEIGTDNIVFTDVTAYITATEAAILKGGPTIDSDTLHTHVKLSNFIGVGDATLHKDFYHFNLPFIISANVPSGDFWTNVGYTINTTSAQYIDVSNVGAGSFITDDKISPFVSFASSKKVIVEFELQFNGAGNAEGAFGLVEGTTVLQDFNDQTEDAACFSFENGTLYAHTADAGVGFTNTDISSGITLSNRNTYRIEFDGGTDVKFYINGVLKATHTTNLPNSADIKFGFGTSLQGEDPSAITTPYLSIEK